MSSNKDDGRTPTCGREPPSEFYAGDCAELNIEHKAAEPGMLRVREKRFRRAISNRLKSGRAQESTERAANAFVVINNRNISGGNAAH